MAVARPDWGDYGVTDLTPAQGYSSPVGFSQPAGSQKASIDAHRALLKRSRWLPEARKVEHGNTMGPKQLTISFAVYSRYLIL